MLDLKRPIVFFDIETTGLDTEKDRIVQFAGIRVHPDESQAIMVHVLNPGISIPKEASDVHGFTDEMVKDKPYIQDVAGEIAEFFEDADMAGYNIARFDVPVLWAELRRCGHKLPLCGATVLDVCEIFFNKEPRDLKGALRFYCGRDEDNLHDALVDVHATIAVLAAQLAKYSDLPAEPGAIVSAVRDPNAVDLAGKLLRTERGIILNFGKYKGVPVDKVGADYLLWLLKNNVIGPDASHLIAQAVGFKSRVE